MSSAVRENIAVVAIGRNEGERLRRCLRSALRDVDLVVYVDSGSSDESVRMARAMGVEVVELDMNKPFAAARARNAGIHRALALKPELAFVQVVDGDCEIAEGWIAAAHEAIQDSPRVAVVCGRRRERQPDASVYNRLCDMEWDTPVGEAAFCGGDALVRVAAFKEAGGYDETVIAGEEPELCVRLRLKGWRIRRIDREMTLHDAQMTRFRQWWRRAVRSGHAFAEGRAMHGKSRARHFVHEVQSIIEWGFLLPAVAIALAWVTWGLSLLLLGAYGLLWRRVRASRLGQGDLPEHASLYATYCVIGKFPELVGVAWYWWNRLRGRRTGIIEYKGASEQAIMTPQVEGPST